MHLNWVADQGEWDQKPQAQGTQKPRPVARKGHYASKIEKGGTHVFTTGEKDMTEIGAKSEAQRKLLEDP